MLPRLAPRPAFGALALLALLVWVLWAAPAAHAHATYTRSDPPSGGQLATPGRIRATFSEDVDPSFSEMQVFDSARRQVDLGDTRPVPNDPKSLTVSVPQLPDGTYTVAWKTLSAVDGHTIRGAFPLVVGDGEAAVTVEMQEVVPGPFEVVLRAVSFIGILTLVGGFAFAALVMIPTRRGPVRTDLLAQISVDWLRRFRRFGLLLVGLLLVVNALWLGFQIVSATDLPVGAIFGEPLARYLGTRNGFVWIAKTLLLLALAGSLLLLSRRALVLTGLLFGGAFMLGTSLSSHAAALPRGAELAVTADWLHQLGAACWLGSLVAALLLLPSVLRTQPTERAALLAMVVPRLSTLAMSSVVLLVATGVFGALIQVGSLPAFQTVYGGALLVKIGALVPMLLLGAANLLIFKPRFVAMASERAKQVRERVSVHARRFRLALAAEVALSIVVLVATGVLTSAESSREVWARQPRIVEATATAEDLRINLRIAPGRVGENEFHVEVLDATSGTPAADIQRVQLRFNYLDQELGRGTRTAQERAPGVYEVLSNDLSVAGRWQTEVAVRRLNREDTIAAFRYEIGVPAGESGGSAIPLPAFSSAFVPIALGLVVAAAAAAIWSWASPGLRRSQRRGFSTACAIVALTAGLIVVRSANFGPDLRSLRNPIPPSSASLAQGQELYLSSGCVDCHGESGRGDGPLGRTLRPRPADFRVHMAAGHTDGELFDWISNGVPGTAMPAYKDSLTEQERWHLINFIRGFAEGEAAEAPTPGPGG